MVTPGFHKKFLSSLPLACWGWENRIGKWFIGSFFLYLRHFIQWRGGIDNGYSTSSSSVATTGFIAERAADRFLVASLTSDHFIRLGIDQYLVRFYVPLLLCVTPPYLGVGGRHHLIAQLWNLLKRLG